QNCRTAELEYLESGLIGSPSKHYAAHDILVFFVIFKEPKTLGKPLTKNFNKYWRYRVGECRVICNLEGELLTIMVVRVGKRKSMYRKNIS
ncbi:hypothetical protein BMR11_12300, partial [Methylococcaceae bacterium CS5]